MLLAILALAFVQPHVGSKVHFARPRSVALSRGSPLVVPARLPARVRTAGSKPGVIKETFPLERRVVQSSDVNVKTGAGLGSLFADEAHAAGAQIVSKAWSADVVLKIRQPTELQAAKVGSRTLVSLLDPTAFAKPYISVHRVGHSHTGSSDVLFGRLMSTITGEGGANY
ncbi:hypothetical protein T492DRAFT_507052 [Pavlovales sp. CCMP2436]|nr:hypothetical protein T492DRAFT_507052 [Pavlovales sp. CCMP2436]